MVDDVPLFYAPRIEQTPEAVRAALDADQRELFDEELVAATTDAASEDVLDRWWGIAQIQAKGPGTRERIEGSGVPGNYLFGSRA